MKGTILAPGTISGSDGKRYSYEPSEVRNPEITASAGMQADFELTEDGKVKDIYLIPVNTYAIDNDASAVRTQAIIATIFGWLLVVPFLGFVCFLISFILWILVYRRISRVTGVKGFFLLIICGSLLSLISGIFLFADITSFIGFGRLFDYNVDNLKIIVSLAGSICYLMIYLKLTRATGVGLFLLCGLLKLLSFIPFVGWGLSSLATILEIVAWVKTSKLIRPTEATTQPSI